MRGWMKRIHRKMKYDKTERRRIKRLRLLVRKEDHDQETAKAYQEKILLRSEKRLRLQQG